MTFVFLDHFNPIDNKFKKISMLKILKFGIEHGSFQVKLYLLHKYNVNKYNLMSPGIIDFTLYSFIMIYSCTLSFYSYITLIFILPANV